MIQSRPRLAILALSGVLAAGLSASLAAAQPADSASPPAAPGSAAGSPGASHHGAAAPHAARSGHLHGTASPHVTPKRQHVMEQQMRARHGADPESAEIDRLNSMSLQRAQGGTDGTPAAASQTPPR